MNCVSLNELAAAMTREVREKRWWKVTLERGKRSEPCVQHQCVLFILHVSKVYILNCCMLLFLFMHLYYDFILFIRLKLQIKNIKLLQIIIQVFMYMSYDGNIKNGMANHF